ncbi:S8 family serine peptidase [Noviherbaspirillum pedocola]|uniref:S8 family serine peptidase n=1 Tax=Noviherbaspirillum pedocola TaxID=2801341 RepID=A0A934SRA4_9BURK|nr:S8 family serine peptidase [Noviherbaspirillum pedocola]MBK4735135.1 S8 family serine peptidase [Noviherbaspirillum pedocola]
MNYWYAARARTVVLSRISLCIVALLGLQAPAFAANAISSQQSAAHGQNDAAGDFATNRLLVVPRAGLSDQNLTKLLSPLNARSRRMGKSSLHVVEVPPGSATAIAARLKNHPQIKLVELDRRLPHAFMPNDPVSPNGGAWHLNKIGATTAWDSTMGAGVTIAILDSGVNAWHPDLAANMVSGYNAVDYNSNTDDTCGHGTAVAGTAAAVINNGQGTPGIAGQSRIMPVKVAAYDSSYNDCYAYYSTVTNGIVWAADHGARIANVSYSGVAGSTGIQNAGNYLKSKGGLLFVSAGNMGRDENLPRTSSMVVVSATDNNDNLASWSSYGSFVSISAPGTGIWTTTRDGGYQAWSGTSFSSPLTAGVAALMMSANPSLDSATVESLLYSTAVDLGTPGRDSYFGYGRLNAAAAVQAAVSRLPKPIDKQAPVAAITAPQAYASVSGLVPVDVSATDNVGVVKVELTVNGKLVASDTGAPLAFSWDSAGVPNGMATLVATAYDAAGNSAASAPVAVNVANAVAVAAPAQKWVQCATEDNTCNFSGTHLVRYGANNSYAYQTIASTVSCTNDVFGDPMVGVRKTCEYDANSTPAVSWAQCANEWGVCNFSGTRQVRYGANGSYAYKTATASVSCTNDIFGDPAYGIAKTCEYASNSTTTQTAEVWTWCSSEYNTCSFAGTREVKYGVNGVYTSKIVTGPVACSNAIFGDPVVGAAKECLYSSISR